MTNATYSKEYKVVIKRLKKARITARLTQIKVAKMIKKPQSFISKSESGERRLDITEIKKFADIYNKKIDYFIGESNCI